MLKIKEIFEKFEKLHSYSFTTIGSDSYPEVRIAHFLTYDDEGLYFQTMNVKPFYSQLIHQKKIAVCALVANEGKATHDKDGLSYFPPGYYIRTTGDVKEISFLELKEKAKKDPIKFNPLILDIERYPTMTTFVLHKFRGEVYDYDFEKKYRNHKLERERFSFNNMELERPGFYINKEKCIACGLCKKVCTFNAIVKGDKYSIDGSRCDECGSCYTVCPTNAIIAKNPLKDNKRSIIGKKVLNYSLSKKLI